MTIKNRFDTATFKATIDENGFLVDTPVVARLGVQVYYMEDGSTVREFRPAEEVFKEESLASYQGKPMTLDHVFVNSDNAKDVVVGSVTGKAEALGSTVIAPIVVYSQEAIDEARSGNAKELSVGYSAVLDETPGWGDPATGNYILRTDNTQGLDIPPDWQEFDAIQRDIKVNHLAMVFRGRAGIAKLNMDGQQENPYTNNVDSIKEDVKEMVKIKLDGAKEFEIAPEVASHIEAVKADSAKEKAKADAMEAERDALKAKVDAMPAEIEKAVAKAKADADALAALVAVAAEAGVKADGLDAKGIKVAYVKEVSGLDVSEKSDAYIDAAFDIAKESDKMAEVRKATVASDKSDGKDEVKVLNPRARLAKIKK